MPSVLLATVSPSDEIDEIFWWAALICFLLAVVLAVTVWLGGWLAPRRRDWWKGLAVAAILLSLYPIAFMAYIHHIDYVPVEVDGTKASGPLWKALLLPCLPLMLSLVYLARSVLRP